MALCLRLELGGRNSTLADWDDRKLVHSTEVNVSRGRPLAPCFDGTPKVYVAKKNPPALTWLSLGFVVLVIGRLKKIIEQYADDTVEFIPVETYLRASKRAEPVPWPSDDQFFIVNPLNVVDCIDEDKSTFDQKIFVNDIHLYEKMQFMYFKQEIIRELSIFRVLGVTYQIFMIEELVRDLKKSNSRGALWTPPEEIYRPPERYPQLWQDRPRRSDRI